MHALFHIRTVIIPLPISTLGLKPSDRYRSLGMITVLIWKKSCINLFITYWPISVSWEDNSPDMEKDVH